MFDRLLETHMDQETAAATGGSGLGVCDKVQANLRGSCYPLVRGIVCEYSNGVLTLRGKLPSFFLKQIAFSLVRAIDRVDDVNDLIEVVPRGDWTS